MGGAKGAERAGRRGERPAPRPKERARRGRRPSLETKNSPTLPTTPSARATAPTIVARAPVPGVGLMGRKAGMTQVFTEDGRAVPATVIAVGGGNVVTGVRTPEKDGYTAVQVGYGECKEKALTRPELGHLKKAGAPPLRTLVEFRVPSAEGYEPGAALSLADTFKAGDVVDVAGTSIGKGFQGAIKRWNHKRGLMTHGSKSKRQHGSIGSSATPSRVLPGLKMAGRMGGERVKIRGLEVLSVDADLNAIIVKGSIPGKPGGVVEVTPAKVVGKNC